MKIEAVCLQHPNARVYILEGTTKFLMFNDGESYTTENTERASFVELDECNLYCTADDKFMHDVRFVVVEDSLMALQSDPAYIEETANADDGNTAV